MTSATLCAQFNHNVGADMTPRTDVWVFVGLGLVLATGGCQGELQHTLEGDGSDDIPSALSVSCSTAAAWAPGASYAVNALVSFQGATYRCLQAHTALDVWTPPVVPALWSAVACASD